MGKLKKWIASLSAAAILSTLLVTSASAQFTDVQVGSWYYDYVMEAHEMELVQGDENTPTFRPNDPITRGGTITILGRAQEGTEDSATATAQYGDVDGNEWYAGWAGWGLNEGVLDSSKANFLGTDNVNRAELAKMAVEAFDFESDSMEHPFVDVPAGEWYADYVATLYNLGVINGKTAVTYDPSGSATRAEVTKVFLNSWKVANGVVDECEEGEVRNADGECEPVEPVCEEGEELVDGECEPVEPCDPGLDGDCIGDASGDVEVSLSGMSPAGGTVPNNSIVTMLVVDLTAGDEDAGVDTLSFKRGGVGNDSDFDKVYLYELMEDGSRERLTRGKVVSSDDGLVEFDVELAISAGETRTVALVADVADKEVYTEGSFSVPSADAVEVANDGEATGDFPVRGSLFGLSVTDGGTATISKSGNITDPYVGQKGAVLGKFEIEVGSVEDLLLKNLGVTFDGVDEVRNLQLKRGEEVVAETAGLGQQDIASFTFVDGYLLEEDSDQTFTLVGDIMSDAGDEGQVYIDEVVDIELVGVDYPFGVAVDIDGYDGDPCTADDNSACSFFEVQGGDITIAHNGPGIIDVADGSDDQVLLEGSLTTGDLTYWEKATFEVYMDDNANNDPYDGTVDANVDKDGLVYDDPLEPNLTSFRLINKETGERLLGGTRELSGNGSDAVQTLVFEDYDRLEAGETYEWALVANVRDGVEEGTEIGVEAVIQNNGWEFSDSNDDQVSANDIVPSTLIRGNVLTVVESKLISSLSSTVNGTTLTKGARGASVLAFTLRPTDTSATVEEITVLGLSDEDGDLAFNEADEASIREYVSSLELWVGGEKVATASNSGNDYNFDGLSVDLVQSQAKTFVIKANLLGNIDEGFIGFAIDNTLDIRAVDNDGDNIYAQSVINFVANVPDPVEHEVIDSGTLQISANDNDARLVAAGTDDVLVSSYEFEATKQAMEVTELTAMVADEADGDAPDRDPTPDFRRAVKTLYVKYMNEDEEEVTASAVVEANGYAQFDLADPIYVPKDENVTVEFLADLNTATGNGDAVSGDEVRVLLTADVNPAVNQFRANGVGTGAVSFTAADFAGGNPRLTFSGDHSELESLYLRKGLPVITVPDGADSGDLAGGQRTLLRYEMTAEGNDITWISMDFDLAGAFAGGVNNGGLSNFTFYENNQPVDNVTITLKAAADGGLAGGQDMTNVTAADFVDDGNAFDYLVSVTKVGAGDFKVPVGSTKTYELRANVVTTDDADNVATSLLEDANPVDGIANAAADTHHFTWNDKYVTPYNVLGGTWINGNLVDELSSNLSRVLN